MSTLVTRAGKGSPLTHNEVDANFTNLNTDKVEKTSAAITGGTIDNTVIGGTTPAAGTFTTLIGGGGSANYFQTQGSETTKAVEAKALGSDTNIAFVIDSKGTGAIDLAAGSSGVNISNGGTVTAITRTATGSGYTSIPAVAISAPTTAGGVQATAVVGSMVNTGSAVVSGGTGYAVGNTLTVVGGTNTGIAATLTVTAVSGGVITTATPLNFGQYTVLPTNPVSVTGGAGTGATFNLTWGIGSNPSFTITNAGSGYVEQPTVSFSGGGGSGAAAYATVGSGTTVRSLGGTMLFNTPGGTQFAASDSANTSNAYWQAVGGAATADLRTAGAGVSSGAISTQSAIPILFRTNFTEQLRVSHTASAVNYVQVTGAATGGRPTISAQGSDSNIGFLFDAKGTTSNTVFRASGGSQIQFVISNVGVGTNYLQTASSATGFGPVISAQGSDANIPVVVQPKGTGALQAQQTDSTATGGNARGANAVDWQTTRSAASQVANGSAAVIGGGQNNTASVLNSTVGGGLNNTISGGYGTISGGYNNSVSNGGFNFIGGGNSNTNNGTTAVLVGGSTNTSSGLYGVVGGGFTNSTTANAAVTTQSGTMNGTTAVTLSGSNASIKVGQYITGTSIAGDTYVAAISGTSLTLSKVASGSSTSTLSFYTPHGVVVGGGNNQATGSYSFIGGGGDAGTAANRNVASGDWSVVGGGTTNSSIGAYSFIGGGRSNNIGSGAIGSVIAGGGDFGGGASGNTITSAASTISGGFANTITAYGSVITGGAGHTANGQYSVVLGSYAATTRSIQGNAVIGSNAAFSGTQGTAQLGIIVINAQTTDATATILRSNTSAASGTNQVILPNNSAYYFKGSVIANVTGGGNTKAWEIDGAIKRGANAASTALVGTPTVTSNYADAGASTWAITATADTTNGGLKITFTGQASTTIRCVCKLETTEVTF